MVAPRPGVKDRLSWPDLSDRMRSRGCVGVVRSSLPGVLSGSWARAVAGRMRVARIARINVMVWMVFKPTPLLWLGDVTLSVRVGASFWLNWGFGRGLLFR